MRKTELIILIMFFFTCHTYAEDDRPSIRYMLLTNHSSRGMLEINGDLSYFSEKDKQGKKTKRSIDSNFGIKLFKDFYSIRNLESFLHKGTNTLYSKGNFIFMVHDERPQYYSKKSLVYVFSEEEYHTKPNVKSFVDRYMSLLVNNKNESVKERQ